MKKIILQLCIATGFVIAASATGFAQFSQSYRAHIPFDFSVRDAQMKAGDYRINPVVTASGATMLQIVDLDRNRSKVLGVVNPTAYRWNADRGKGSLSFINDGNQYTLSGVETATFRMRMPKVTASARVLARHAVSPATVSVALQ